MFSQITYRSKFYEFSSIMRKYNQNLYNTTISSKVGQRLKDNKNETPWKGEGNHGNRKFRLQKFLQTRKILPMICSDTKYKSNQHMIYTRIKTYILLPWWFLQNKFWNLLICSHHHALVVMSQCKQEEEKKIEIVYRLDFFIIHSLLLFGHINICT